MGRVGYFSNAYNVCVYLRPRILEQDVSKDRPLKERSYRKKKRKKFDS